LLKPKIKIRFQNGLSFWHSVHEILDYVGDYYEFIDSDDPDFIIFGPYGNNIPAKSDRYTRIGYFCENVKPDMSICEWGFGMSTEEVVNHPRYKKIQWHGLDPQAFIKPADYDAEKLFDQKKHFCNFLYSHKVPYREEFFRQLSKYKKVDAPGKSMNNMKGIDELYQGDVWERKRQFLGEYKFTIAFENYSYPGYQTEKLFDAMLVNSIPVYCGDPFVNSVFNTESFISATDYIRNDTPSANWLEKYSQPDFVDIRPQFYHNPVQRIKRRLKTIGREKKMNIQLNNLDFSPVIERIIELDQDKQKYIQMLSQPWFSDNKIPAASLATERWREIFG
jgi:hypothetical protein